MTGFHAATVSSQPLSCERGTYDDVRNRNGKNRRKALFTAAGLPVLRAMAYPKPAKARLQSAASSTNTSTPSGPAAKCTPRTRPRTTIGRVSAPATATSASMWPSRIASRRTGVSRSLSK